MQAAAGVFGDSSGECLNAMIWWVILLNVQCGWLLLLIFLSVWVLILDHLVNYSRKVKNRCRCPLQTIVCMLMLIFVLLCYFIWFTWIVLLCWPASCSCYFDWRVMLYDVFFFCMQITDWFHFCHEAAYGGDAQDPLLYCCPDLEVHLIMLFVQFF